MTLRTSLNLSISAIRTLAFTPQPEDDSFRRLLTQSGDAIITQNQEYIVAQNVGDPQTLPL